MARTPSKNSTIVDTTPEQPPVEYGDGGIKDITGDEPIPDMGLEDDEDDEVDFSDLDQPQQMTTTQNFMGSAPVIVNEVQDSGIRIVEGVKVRRVRTIEDIGPVFYGDDLIELKKGRLYEVPEHIYDYLRTRDKLWEQQ